ncbi:hypothetical protein [Emticicia sp. BO119]|uniref:hypothetical protein n=1 Tax=Emticicia sp. BO119 TaxID=2757768 RepID=UPI0015EFE3C0|nr:hypothetical protein [Emticicia sp. BO119]MBA4851425.1 hypothetical protein [Emticicia sp. BO119]
MNKSVFFLAGICAIFLVSCTSTRITSSWKEPDKTVTLNNLNKVLVVAMLKDETSRRKAEDQMKKYLNGKGVVSYNYLDRSISEQDEQQILNKIRADNFDGAIIMRLIDVDKDVDYVPGTISSYPVYYRTFGGFYRRSWVYYSTPNRYYSTKTYTVEVTVFSIKDDRIIWTGLTESTEPGGVDKMTREVAKVVYDRMVEEGFITK